MTQEKIPLYLNTVLKRLFFLPEPESRPLNESELSESPLKSTVPRQKRAATNGIGIKVQDVSGGAKPSYFKGNDGGLQIMSSIISRF
ncbi:hypothetical protein CDAR_379521 [Caerostris darwini]|uniref:Uncharacterized protein n=1 Tax=Caerostris darwini TaxID=1538125 RepID=A0AAV4VAC3_9ARAC|nr:hypothetical protein CDAR_379521 [Caerostris darwini]